MGLSPEARGFFQRAKKGVKEVGISVLDVLARPLRTVILSKDKIERTEGGEEAWPDDPYLVLFEKPALPPSETERKVTVIDRGGRETHLHEIGPNDKVREDVTVYKQ